MNKFQSKLKEFIEHTCLNPNSQISGEQYSDLIKALLVEGTRLEQAAHIDYVTGLGNKRKFESDLGVHLAMAGRNHRAKRSSIPFDVFMADVGGLKYVNDHFGQANGDSLLITAADYVRGFSQRGHDLSYRIGGDEFTFIHPGTEEGDTENFYEHFKAAARHIRPAANFEICPDMQINEKELETARKDFPLILHVGCLRIDETNVNTFINARDVLSILGMCMNKDKRINYEDESYKKFMRP